MDFTDVVHQRLNQDRYAVSCVKTLGIEDVRILLVVIPFTEEPQIISVKLMKRKSQRAEIIIMKMMVMILIVFAEIEKTSFSTEKVLTGSTHVPMKTFRELLAICFFDLIVAFDCRIFNVKHSFGS